MNTSIILIHHTLEALSNPKGLLGLIVNKSQNKFDSAHPWPSPFGRAAFVQFCSGQSWRCLRICQDPAKRRRLAVDLNNKEKRVSIGRLERSQLAGEPANVTEGMN